jgi:hypothetical protein
MRMLSIHTKEGGLEMSLKSIDLQMAVHRNGDAGLQQNQLLHKPVADQALLANEQEKKIGHQLLQSNSVDESRKAGIQSNDSGKGNQGSGGRNGKRRDREDSPQAKSKHPYKGQHIDFSL